MMVKQLSDIINLAKSVPVKRLVLVNGVDKHSLQAVHLASEMGFVQVTIIGQREVIGETCQKLNIDPDIFLILNARDEDDAAMAAVKIIHSGRADIIMKGLISTDKYMRALLNKDFGLLPNKGVLSHIAVIENPHYHKLLIVSDVAVIPYPDFAQKLAMVNYLIQTACALGIQQPKIALIAPTEKMLPSIPACTESAMLTKMAESGQIRGGIIDGPMALDVAIDKESAQVKGINSPVAGDADCLLFPNIDAGNVFYKMSAKLCRSEQAAVVVGGRTPAVLSSRGDSTRTKLNSIALAAILSK